jgi:hypothetical protein
MSNKKGGFFGTFRYLFLVAVLALGLIAVIGSGGDDDSTTTGGTAPVDLTDIGGTIYNSAQSVGDLLQVAFNPTTLQYGYTVIEGINAGDSGTGTLSLMAGYTEYVYETEDNVPVIVFPDNVFIAIPGGTDEGLMVGVPSLATSYTAADIAGVYNYVQFAGTGGDVANYEGTYGTFRVNAGGTWDHLEEGNLPASGGTPDDSGTWSDQGNGIIYAYRGAAKIANVMIHPSYAGSATEQVLIIDINDQASDFRGIMLGVKQQSITSGSVDATYALLESDHTSITTIIVNGTTVTTPDGPVTVTYDSPWTGFVQAPDNTIVLMLPGGIFFGGGEDVDGAWIFAGIDKNS